MCIKQILGVMLLLGPLAVYSAEFQGEVIRVLDGDTVDVLHDSKPVRIPSRRYC